MYSMYVYVRTFLQLLLLQLQLQPRRGRRQGFFLPIPKKGAPMIMEPLVYLLVTAATLPSCLAYLRQVMAMLHVVYASVSTLLDMGGARLIRDLGGIII